VIICRALARLFLVIHLHPFPSSPGTPGIVSSLTTTLPLPSLLQEKEKRDSASIQVKKREDEMRTKTTSSSCQLSKNIFKNLNENNVSYFKTSVLLAMKETLILRPWLFKCSGQ
jgi:hypothetical protein